jgi:hypothetical protein
MVSGELNNKSARDRNRENRRVFEHLDLPWIDPRSRMTAALLALFVGWFGFHHFYLGNGAVASTTWRFAGP